MPGVHYLVSENGLLVFHYAVHNMQYVQLSQELLSVLLFVYSFTQVAYRCNIFYVK